MTHRTRAYVGRLVRHLPIASEASLTAAQLRAALARVPGDSHIYMMAGISDEHQREVEYVARAGESAGFEVPTDAHSCRLPTKVIPDALIYGPHTIGIEIQHSYVKTPVAKTRTTKAKQAGVESLWFSDNRRDPSWMWHVPGVRMMDLPWDEVPPSGFVKVVSGVRSIIPRRCRSIRNGGCPERRYGCNRWHPDHEPYPVLVDDLAAAAPNGIVVPMLWRPHGGRGHVVLVRATDKARYEGMTGLSAEIPFRKRERPPQQEVERIACASDAGPVIDGSTRFAPWIADVGQQPMLVEIEPRKTRRPKLNELGQLYAALDLDDPRRYAL